ncbi:hypothetical protein AAFF_G00158630 [Aldrovandia affinis]|uniref:Intermediate filament head DNA-binding domain-containing protein n=1 Tax=Aldrovandia affinis TaxID=143900 RepID=A0AAD7W8E1_9TELE|nr:hypothetical protein AAFF_G00158630 [Aldrovandia affinis]
MSRHAYATSSSSSASSYRRMFGSGRAVPPFLPGRGSGGSGHMASRVYEVTKSSSLPSYSSYRASSSGYGGGGAARSYAGLGETLDFSLADA